MGATGSPHPTPILEGGGEKTMSLPEFKSCNYENIPKLWKWHTFYEWNKFNISQFENEQIINELCDPSQLIENAINSGFREIWGNKKSDKTSLED